MQVKVTLEAGYDQALEGMSYSYLDEADDREEWWAGQQEKAVKRSVLLCPKTPEHSKFLRFICIWADVRATRAFWQEFDTYKQGVERLSASTMHKLAKRRPTHEDFSDNTPSKVVDVFIEAWKVHKDDIVTLKDSLPEGYLQTRKVWMNYTALRNIISQRKDHRYKYWRTFVNEMLTQIEHPELVQDLL